MGDIAKISNSTTLLPAARQVLLQFKSISESLRCFLDFDRWNNDSVRRCHSALPAALELINSDDYADLARELAELQRPSSTKHLADQLARLTVAWPNTAKADLRGYGAQLAADVAAENPSTWAIEQACRTLRRTNKFLPCISEVIEAIEREERHLANSTRLMALYHKSVLEAEKEIAALKREHQQRQLAKQTASAGEF